MALAAVTQIELHPNICQYPLINYFISDIQDDNTAIEEETSETFEESEAFIDASLLCNVQINENTDSAIGSSENLGVPGGSIQNLLKEQVLLPLPYLEKSGAALAPPTPPFPLPLHPEKNFQCPICFKGFKLKPVLKRHMKEVHDKRKREEEKSYNCPICPQLFSAKAAVQRHITQIHGKYPFQCTMCPAKFALKGRFNRHLTVVHERKRLDKSNSHGAISETRVHDGNVRGFMPNINVLGGFQLLDLIITELKSLMTCYNPMSLIGC